MKSLKHKKIKNTWLLFDVLTRQIVSESFDIDAEQLVKNENFKIIDKYFINKTNLNKELSLYKMIIEGKGCTENNVNDYIETIIKNYTTKINISELQSEKYNLVGDIRRTFENQNKNLDFALQSNVKNYKLVASIYNIFEYISNDDVMYNIEQYMDAKNYIYEYLTNKVTKKYMNESDLNVMDIINNADDEIDNFDTYKSLDNSSKLLLYKVLTEKFNNKYKEKLNKNQKRILKKYVYSVYDSEEFNQFIINEFQTVTKIINDILPAVHESTVDSNKIIEIKLNEIKNQISSILNKKLIKEKYVLALLKAYKLFDDVRTTYKGK